MIIDNNKGIHPGFILKQELKKRNLGYMKFAISVEEFPQSLSAIMSGNQAMNIPLALKIEKLLSLEEGYFMMLQLYYDIEQHKIKSAEILNQKDLDLESISNKVITEQKEIERRLAYHNIGPEKKQNYLRQIEKILTTKKLFLNYNFAIIDLSKETGIPAHHISTVINTEFNFRFQDYINLKRIAYFKDNINNPKWEELTLEAMALRSGFKSRTTCFRAFIKHTRKSPYEYFNELQLTPNKKRGFNRVKIK